VLFDPNVVRITEVSLAQATSSFTLQTNLTAGRLQAALASTRAVAGTGPVLTLRVRLIGPPGTASLLDLALAVLNEGAFTVSRRNGLVSVVREARILGGVFYRSSMLAVPGVAITATEQASGAVQRATTDANGGYLMGAVPLGSHVAPPPEVGA
jgi:hypothetical protein